MAGLNFHDGCADLGCHPPLCIRRDDLVIGGNNLRVWDLQNLPAKLSDRKPVVYAGSDAKITAVQFVNNSIVQTSSSEGSAQWDVATGNVVTDPADANPPRRK